MSKTLQHLINGRLVGGDERIISHNPATGEMVADIPAGGADEVERPKTGPASSAVLVI